MFNLSRWSKFRPQVDLQRVLRLVSLLCILTLSAVGAASAQPAAEESPDEATVLLLPYLLHADDAPAGYSLTSTLANPSESEAFEAAMIPPVDPRPMEAILSQYADAGRIVRLRQGFENRDEKDSPEIGFLIAAFRDAPSAARAVENPRLLVPVLQDAQVAAITAPAFGNGIDAVAAHTVDQTFDQETGSQRSTLVLWQRGRLVFATVGTGSADTANASVPSLMELAARADIRIAGLTAFPAQIGLSPAYMPSAAERLNVYKALADRLPADEALGEDLASFGVVAIPNALIIFDSKIADAPVSDARFVKDRLLNDEHRILGIALRFSAAHPNPANPDTSYPGVALGYHVYADVAGAQEAFGAPNAEMALRINEEIYLLNNPTRQVVTDATSTFKVGDQTRTMTSRITLDDGSEADFTSVRWRRSTVELFADVVNPVGTDSTSLIRTAVESLDAAYMIQPLAGS